MKLRHNPRADAANAGICRRRVTVDRSCVFVRRVLPERKHVGARTRPSFRRENATSVSDGQIQNQSSTATADRFLKNRLNNNYFPE